MSYSYTTSKLGQSSTSSGLFGATQKPLTGGGGLSGGLGGGGLGGGGLGGGVGLGGGGLGGGVGLGGGGGIGSSGLFGGGSLMPQRTGTGSAGLFQQGGGGGLFQQGGGSGLFQQGGVSSNFFQQGGGGLFPPHQGYKQGGGGLFPQSGSAFSILPGQKMGLTQSSTGSSLFGGSTTGTHFPDMSKARQNKYQVSLQNPIREKKVSELPEKFRNIIEQLSKVLSENQKKTEELKIENTEIRKKKESFANNSYQFSQDAKQLYMKLKQARYLVDEMKSNLATYEDITTRNFDVCLDLLKGGRLPRLDIPSTFMSNLTEYFELRIKELNDKIGEIEELVKLPEGNEDSDVHEKIIMVIDELNQYYLSVANKVFQMSKYVEDFKNQFVEYYIRQGSREVEKIFVKKETEASGADILEKLETISTNSLNNKHRIEEIDKKNEKALMESTKLYK